MEGRLQLFFLGLLSNIDLKIQKSLLVNDIKTFLMGVYKIVFVHFTCEK